jgi:hypothetical protein
MRIELKEVTVNRGRVYAQVDHGKHIDITGALSDPAAAIDLLLAEERLRQISEQAAERRALAVKIQGEILDENARHEGARL